MPDSDITVSGLTLTPGIGHNLAKWSYIDPNANGLDYLKLDAVELHAAASNDRTLAFKVGEGRDTAAHMGLVEGATWYYWIKARNRAGFYGDWFPSGATAGVQATVSFASDFTLIGGKIVATVAANALTVAIKLPNGDDPSTTNPVRIVFRSAAGVLTTRSITAACSFTASSGSTFGVTTNDQAFRLWVVALDDTDGTGEVVIGVMNRITSQAGVIRAFPLSDSYRSADTLAEGGAGGADVSGNVYTETTLVGGRPMRIIGYLTWGDGLPATGAWSAEPTVTQLYGPNIPRPDEQIQRYEIHDFRKTTYAFGGSDTTPLPIDDTIPALAERAIYTQANITPTDPANYIELVADAWLSPPAANQYVALLLAYWTGATIAIGLKRSEGADIPVPVHVHHLELALTTDERQFTLDIGYSTTGTVTLNGSAGSRLFGGVMQAKFTAVERMG